VGLDDALSDTVAVDDGVLEAATDVLSVDVPTKSADWVGEPEELGEAVTVTVDVADGVLDAASDVLDVGVPSNPAD